MDSTDIIRDIYDKWSEHLEMECEVCQIESIMMIMANTIKSQQDTIDYLTRRLECQS